MNKTRRCVQICLVAWGSKNYLGSRKIFRIKKQIITVFVILIFSPLYQGKNIEANLTFACFFQNLDGQKKVTNGQKVIERDDPFFPWST